MTAQQYDQSMTTRITVSLPDHLVEAVRREVANGTADSVSAFVADAIGERLPALTLAEFLAEMDREFGPGTPEDRAWAKAELARTDAEWAAIRRGD